MARRTPKISAKKADSWPINFAKAPRNSTLSFLNMAPQLAKVLVEAPSTLHLIQFKGERKDQKTSLIDDALGRSVKNHALMYP